jgi:hypothetical protein
MKLHPHARFDVEVLISEEAPEERYPYRATVRMEDGTLSERWGQSPMHAIDRAFRGFTEGTLAKP